MKINKKGLALVLAIIGVILIVSAILISCFFDSKNKDSKVDKNIYYSVVFDYGDNQVDKLEFENGSKVTEPQIPVKDNMVFLGWYLNDKLYNFDLELTSDVRLYAKWQEMSKNQVSVTFDSNGGSFVEPILLNVGDKVLRPSDPKFNNAIFLGWYLGDELFNFEQSISENIVLIARWDVIKENSNSNINKDNNLNNNTVPNNTILPQSIFLNLSDIDLYCGNIEPVKATVLPAQASDKSVKWSSSNNKVATVDEKGNITPVSIGEAVITASTINGKKDTVNVTVKEVCNNAVSKPKPGKVSGVFVKYTQYNSVSIYYDKTDNGYIYEIYQSGNNSNYTLLSSFSSLIGELDGIDTNKDNYYKVRACTNNNTCGEFSDVVYVPAKIKAPSNVQFAGTYSVIGNTGEMKISFDLSGADSYYIYSSNVGVDSGNMTEHGTTTTNMYKLHWDTAATQYKVVAKKSGKNYEMYSSSDVYKVPSIGKAGKCDTAISRTETISGTSITYSYQYDYNWDSISDIDGYMLKETSNLRVFQSFSNSVSSYSANNGHSEVTLFTYKKGANYNIETHKACSLSKNY